MSESEHAKAEARVVLVAVRRMIRAVDVHSKRVAKETGLTIPQLVVLQAIAESGEVTTNRLSATVSLSAATVVTIVDKLEAKALVERYRSAADRRVVHHRPTAAGLARLAEAPPLLHERFVAAFHALSPDRRRAIVAALGEVADLLDAVTPVPAAEATPILAVDPLDP